jgi:glycosyltransferase involved in cell wall biosynthesis
MHRFFKNKRREISTMFLSVIIPTYKRRDVLSACLEHLAPEVQNLSLDAYEVIVTDDALADDPSDCLRQNFPWVHHNCGPQKGPAANRNSGAKSAKGEWLIFLDDDCLPEPSFLSAYLDSIQKNPDYLVFEGRTLRDRPQVRLDEEAPLNDNGGYLWSCNFLIQRKLFFELGGFCELYPYACMEDVDFREELNARNLKFLFVPEANVIHGWRSISPDEKYLKVHLVSHAIFHNRHPLLKPSFLKAFHTNIREWARFLFVDAPRLKFRGFWRYFSRRLTATFFQILLWTGFGRREQRS